MDTINHNIGDGIASIFTAEELSLLPTTRKEAKELKIKYFFNNVPCKKDHTSERYTSDGKCVVCKKQYYRDNKERIDENIRRWWANNPDARRRYGNTKLHRDASGRSMEYRPRHRENKEEYDRGMRAKRCAKDAKRQAMKLNQTPDDADPKLILDFYKRAKELNEVYGTDMEVDHIIPLIEGGLHHEDNLQLLPQNLNGSKGSKTDWVHPNIID